MNKAIADIRKDYKLQSLSESDVAPNAIEQFTKWWTEALNSNIEEVNAITLATATKEGKPRARIVLLKDYDERGFVFFTNYKSNKGEEMAANPQAALIFFWKELERQIRIEGEASMIDENESDVYFASRPQASRISAWASPQSKVIESRKILEENVEMYSKKFWNDIPRPPHWGGYRVIPFTIEFWQGRSNRLHDRILYTREGKRWKIERLAP